MRLALVLSLALAGALSAQTRHLLDPGSGVSRERFVIAEVTAVVGGARPGGDGFVRIDLQNPDRVEHVVELAFAQGWREDFVVRDVVRMIPGGSARVFLPMHGTRVGGRIGARIDGGRETWFGGHMPTTGDGNGHVNVLFVSDVRAAELGWRDTLARRAGLASGTIGFHLVEPRDLPPGWTFLSGFDLVLVDGRSRTLDRAVQAVLTDLVEAGGSALVFHADRAVDGPLADVARSTELSGTSLGFGRLLALQSGESSNLPGGPLPRPIGSAIDDWLRAPVVGLPARSTAPLSGPMPAWLRTPIGFADLGAVPLRAFFLLLLAFALVVGPLNYFYWWRRRRLPMLVVSVPLLGLGTTALILTWGLASEGLGLRQAESTITVLDQVRHRGACWTSRSVYAGISPDVLRPRAGTALCGDTFFEAASHQLGPRYERLPDGRVDGALVTPRSVVALPATSVWAERARLRFRRVGADALEPLSDGELSVLPEQDAVVVCDASGECYVGSGTGELRRVERSVASAAAQRLIERIADGGRSEHMPHGTFVVAVSDAEERLSPFAELVPGRYVAMVERSPVFDDLGLEPSERDATHVVVGRLAQEDFVE